MSAWSDQTTTAAARQKHQSDRLLGFAFCRGVAFETLALGFGGGLAPAVLLRSQLGFLFLSAALILGAMGFGFHPALAFLVPRFRASASSLRRRSSGDTHGLRSALTISWQKSSICFPTSNEATSC